GSKGLYIDDLSAHSPSDTSAPVISFYESNEKLSTTVPPAFNRDAKIEIRITDDLSAFTYTAQLDGAPVPSGVVVSAEGTHTLVITAKDKAGHTTAVTRNFSLDKHAPEVSLLANGVAFQANKTYNTAVKFTVVVHSATTATTVITV